MHFIKREEIDAELPGWLADRLAAVADGDGRYALEAAGAGARRSAAAATACGRCSATSRARA